MSNLIELDMQKHELRLGLALPRWKEGMALAETFLLNPVGWTLCWTFVHTGPIYSRTIKIIISGGPVSSLHTLSL